MLLSKLQQEDEEIAEKSRNGYACLRRFLQLSAFSLLAPFSHVFSILTRYMMCEYEQLNVFATNTFICLLYDDSKACRQLTLRPFVVALRSVMQASVLCLAQNCRMIMMWEMWWGRFVRAFSLQVNSFSWYSLFSLLRIYRVCSLPLVIHFMHDKPAECNKQ